MGGDEIGKLDLIVFKTFEGLMYLFWYFVVMPTEV